MIRCYVDDKLSDCNIFDCNTCKKYLDHQANLKDEAERMEMIE